jgi:hypothetical protein
VVLTLWKESVRKWWSLAYGRSLEGPDGPDLLEGVKQGVVVLEIWQDVVVMIL